MIKMQQIFLRKKIAKLRCTKNIVFYSIPNGYLSVQVEEEYRRASW